MVVEAKTLKAEIGGVKAQELEDLGACDTACDGRRVGVVRADQEVGVGAIFLDG